MAQIRLVFLLTFCLGIFIGFYPFLGRGFSCYDLFYF